MIVAVPAPVPVSKPEDDPMDAMLVLLLLQVPEDIVSVSTVDVPTHTSVVPLITEG